MMIEILSLIYVLPIFSSICSGCFGTYLGREGSSLVAVFLLGVVASLSWYGFFDVVLLGNSYRTPLSVWISCGSFHAEWCFLLDSLSMTMLVVITSVSFLVHLYSVEYMAGDPHSCRFFSYISLFTFFMVMLVAADNFVQLFFGWEGVGLCSYLLIGFWYTRVSAGRAALKAVIVNRVADVFILLGMGGCFAVFGSLNYGPVFLLAPLFEFHGLSSSFPGLSALDVVCLLLFGGAMGKSAQVGLHTWLPDAMEGPTPVSALIHAATMVTAGVFLVVRCSPLFEYSGLALYVIALVGVLTSFMAATIALVQHDIKKVIAYSTCSQLGYMFLACGLSNYSIGMFHLFNHAFFKALLFLSAGAVIHGYGDEQDLRGLGGSGATMPLTYTCFFVGSISLAGFPFLSGFYSKDLILATAAASCTPSASFYFFVGSLTAFMTAFYSFRLFFLGLVRSTGCPGVLACNPSEMAGGAAVALFLLGLGSIYSGYAFSGVFVAPGSDAFAGSVFVRPGNAFFIFAEFIPAGFKSVPLMASFSGTLLALVVHGTLATSISRLLLSLPLVFWFLNQKWYFDTLFNRGITRPLLVSGYTVFFRAIDKGLLEFLGPSGFSTIMVSCARAVRHAHTGFIHDSFTMMVVGFLLLFIGPACLFTAVA